MFRSLIYIVTSTLLTRAGGFFYAIAIRRILGPQLVGVWNLMEIVLAYLSIFTLGVSYSSERLIPHHRARGERVALVKVRDALFSWTILEGVVVGIAVLTYGLLFGHRHPQEVRTGLLWLPALLLSQRLLSVYLLLFRTAKAFRTYSIISFLSAVLDWSLIVWAFLGGLRGVFAGAAAIGGAKLLLFLYFERHFVERQSHSGFRWRLDMGTLRLHLPYGFRYAWFKGIWTLFERSDLLVVGYLLGTTALAYYYLGFQLSRLALEIPIALAYIAFPNLVERLATSREGESFSSEFFRYLRIELFLILPLVLPLAYFGSEFAIRHLLPAFEPGLNAVKISVLGIGMLAIRYLYYQVLMAQERLDRLIVVTAAQLPAFVGFLVFVRTFVREPLMAVAASMFLAHGLHVASLLWVTRSLVDRERQGVFRFWWADLFGCLVWCVILLGVDFASPGSMGGTAVHDFVQLLVRIGLFGFVALPVIYLGLGTDRRKLSGAVLKRLSMAKSR